jgi:hypothetical protein
MITFRVLVRIVAYAYLGAHKLPLLFPIQQWSCWSAVPPKDGILEYLFFQEMAALLLGSQEYRLFGFETKMYLLQR